MNFLEDLIRKNNLSVVDGKIAVKPLSKWSGQTYPLNLRDETILYLTVEEYLGLKERLYQFTDDLKRLEYFEVPVTGDAGGTVIESKPARKTVEAAIAELQDMLNDSEKAETE